MTPKAFEAAALALPGASVTVQWGSDRVFKVGGKMFAVLSGGECAAPAASFKCSDVAFEMLTQKKGVIPAPYLARAKWVALEYLRVLPDADLKAYLAEAHRLVVAKLPRRLRP